MALQTRETSAVLCPQPRRVYAASPQDKKLIEESVPSSPFLNGADEASHELHELLGGAKEQLLALRPLSAASTSAGPTPNPEERISTPAWSSPGGCAITPFDDEGNSPSSPSPQPTQALQTLQTHQEDQELEDAKDRSKEVRKVFVGGIPQTMTQDDLYAIFSEVAGVKKAWLQRQRTAVTTMAPPRNHRGFGFVIFHDGTAVEKLLGKGISRFYPLADGRKLEIKRAVSSSDMDDVQPVKGPSPKPFLGNFNQASRPSVESPIPWSHPALTNSPSPPTPTLHQKQAPMSPWRKSNSLPLPAIAEPSEMVPALTNSPCGMGSVGAQASAFAPVTGVYVHGTATMLATQAQSDAAQRLQGGNTMASLPQFPQRGGSDGMVLGQHGARMPVAGQDVRQPWPLSAVPQIPAGGLQLLLPQGLYGTACSRPSGVPEPDSRSQQPHASSTMSLSDRVHPSAVGSAATQLLLARRVWSGTPDPQQSQQAPRTVEHSNKELENILRQAMPDHYDD